MRGNLGDWVLNADQAGEFGVRVNRGKKRKDTVLICLSSDEVDEGKISMNKGGFAVVIIIEM